MPFAKSEKKKRGEEERGEKGEKEGRGKEDPKTV